MTLHARSPRIRSFASAFVVAVLAVLAPSVPAGAQVIVYPGSQGQPQPTYVQPSYAQPQPTYAQPAYGQPVYAPQPQTRGNLVGSAAFYARLSLGIGSDFFWINPPLGSSDTAFSLTGPIAAHSDFSLGYRFAFSHAIHVDFDFDRGFAPRSDGSTVTNGALFAGALGVGYTYFVPNGFYLGGGVGLGIAWLEYTNGYGYTSSSPTGVGYVVHGRFGYDWPLARRAHFGLGALLRFYGLTDENKYRWNGMSYAWTASISWY